MPSYSVRCIFEWPSEKAENLQHLYEERITLWQAADIDEAIGLAEVEADEYAAENDFTFLGLSQAFWLFSEVQANGIEVFSLLRESNLLPQSYLDVFQSTGFERTTYSYDE